MHTYYYYGRLCFHPGQKFIRSQGPTCSALPLSPVLSVFLKHAVPIIARNARLKRELNHNWSPPEETDLNPHTQFTQVDNPIHETFESSSPSATITDLHPHDTAKRRDRPKPTVLEDGGSPGVRILCANACGCVFQRAGTEIGSYFVCVCGVCVLCECVRECVRACVTEQFP